MAATVLLRLAALTGEARYREAAERALATVAPYLGALPDGVRAVAGGGHVRRGRVVEVAVVGDLCDGAAARALLAPVWSRVAAVPGAGRGLG